MLMNLQVHTKSYLVIDYYSAQDLAWRSSSQSKGRAGCFEEASFPREISILVDGLCLAKGPRSAADSSGN
jgi:hypothetical protein